MQTNMQTNIHTNIEISPALKAKHLNLEHSISIAKVVWCLHSYNSVYLQKRPPKLNASVVRRMVIVAVGLIIVGQVAGFSAVM